MAERIEIENLVKNRRQQMGDAHNIIHMALTPTIYMLELHEFLFYHFHMGPVLQKETISHDS